MDILRLFKSAVFASLTLPFIATAALAQQPGESRNLASAPEVAPAEAVDPIIEPTSAERQQWRAIANSRFLTGDVAGALDALNRIGEPRISNVKVEGLVLTKRAVVDDFLGLERGELFTAGKLTLAQRRLEELPVASSANVRYDAIEGSAIVTPIIAERKPLPRSPFDWAPIAARAIFVKEFRLPLSNATGRGEVWTPSYRWAANRPRMMLQFDAPAPGMIPGVLELETAWERQTYQSASLGDGVFREERFRATAGLTDWITSWLRWHGGAGVDYIDYATFLALDGSLNGRGFGDRLAVIVSGGQWYAVNRGDSFVTGEAVLMARSTAEHDVPVLTTMVGITVASKMAPLATWPGAGSGQGRAALLRAHPLTLGGILLGDVFGRQLMFSTTEYEHPIQTTIGPIGVAGFVDVAKATLRLDPTTPSDLHVDIGGGVRFNTSRSGNKVRLDYGYGLRDGRSRISAGYVLPWGRRQ